MTDLVNKVASKAHDKWKPIGTQLGFQEHELNGIAQKEHQDPIGCYTAMFDRWERKGNPPFLWSTILDALRSPAVEQYLLADDIEKDLCA